MGATIIVDALWGDSGKGKLCAHLARAMDADLAIRAGVGTNAGASVTLEDGTEIRARQLPTGWVNPRTRVAVGSGVLVDPAVLAGEISRFGLAGRVMVDFRCALIESRHIEAEQTDEMLRHTVGSTCTGNGAARSDFIMRRARQARHLPQLGDLVADVAAEANRTAGQGVVLVEGSQGTLLSLALSNDYPYTTSDNCTSAAAIDDVGLNWQLVDDVVMVVKALPTRVGEGPLPLEMPAERAEALGIAEYGVVTGRPRRKASGLDFDLLRYSAMLNGPTRVALSFCDHADQSVRGHRDASAVTPKLRGLITQVEEAVQAPVAWLDTGPRLDDIIELDDGRSHLPQRSMGALEHAAPSNDQAAPR